MRSPYFPPLLLYRRKRLSTVWNDSRPAPGVCLQILRDDLAESGRANTRPTGSEESIHREATRSALRPQCASLVANCPHSGLARADREAVKPHGTFHSTTGRAVR